MQSQSLKEKVAPTNLAELQEVAGRCLNTWMLHSLIVALKPREFM